MSNWEGAMSKFSGWVQDQLQTSPFLMENEVGAAIGTVGGLAAHVAVAPHAAAFAASHPAAAAAAAGAGHGIWQLARS